MIRSTDDRRGSRLASAAIALLLLTGCGSGASTQTEAMVVPSPATTPESNKPDAPSSRSSLPPVMAESAPISFSIPAIDASSKLLSLGLQDDGSLEVPPGHPGAPAGWYNQSPIPGERGPAILLGHVNATDGGPGVFADLTELEAGDIITIKREDGTTAAFAVERGEQYAKSDFPTQAVYGNTEGSELRLITCDGYDPVTGEFDDNYVVYAKLVTE